MKDELHALAVDVIHLLELRDVYADATFTTKPVGGRVL